MLFIRALNRADKLKIILAEELQIASDKKDQAIEIIARRFRCISCRPRALLSSHSIGFSWYNKNLVSICTQINAFYIYYLIPITQ
jgi:hypothetical protein